MEVVAKLISQQQQDENHSAALIKMEIKNSETNGYNSSDNKSNSPKETRKDQRKIWKSWSWKHSPGGKSESIEEEPDSPKKSHSSPSESPKHQNHSSPVRRKKNGTPTNSPSKRADNRSSAGARLYQILDQYDRDTSDEELQTLLVSNGRPASIHAIQSSSFNGKIHF